MADKNTIDKIRDSAVSMTVGDDSDGAITGLLKISGKLHIVKEKAIYLVALADEIDPGRTRPSIPNTQQLVVPAGSQSELVCRILLTARDLFVSDRLATTVNCDAALVAALAMLKDVLAAQEIFESYVTAKETAEIGIKPVDNRSFKLPAVPHVETTVKSFVQKSEHAVQNLYRICCAFYPDGMKIADKKWFDRFVAVVKSRSEPDDLFIPFAEAIARFSQLVRNTRHCVEHPKVDQRLEIRDYQLTRDGVLSSPSVEVIHNEFGQPSMPIEQFMAEILQQLLDGCELLMAYLSSRQARPAGGLIVWVDQVPEGRRKDGVRFGYFVSMGGRATPLG